MRSSGHTIIRVYINILRQLVFVLNWVFFYHNLLFRKGKGQTLCQKRYGSQIDIFYKDRKTVLRNYLCEMTKTFLQKKISQRIANGHPWIFRNEIDKIEGQVDAGNIVEVYTHDRKFIGKGYINPKSQINVRLLTRDKN